MQDMEFTVEDGKLYMLQTRGRKRTPAATFKMAVDMVSERLISKEEALMRVKPEDIERLFYPVIDASLPRTDLNKRRLATGISAVPGAAVGKAVFTAHEAEEWAQGGQKVILVRRETSPEDVGGMFVAQGILTATGGKTSHAAVVARGWGKCCVVGCEQLDIDYAEKRMRANGRVVRQGDWITLDGSEGAVYEGEVALIMPELPLAYTTVMKWADAVRRLGVRTNADTPQDARKAREMGAEGIGLCRTEHMFFKDFEQPERSHERQLAIQEMIVAESGDARRKALEKLLPFQRRDFVGLFKAMDGCPVTIRLIDPPLHEFVPHDRAQQEEVARKIGVDAMIELPRAALLADQVAEVAEFFSFGTNDLTQTVMGLSRDDAGRFLPDYVDEKKAGIFPADPFQTLDLPGVGMMIKWAIDRGRKTKPKLKIGICGEHAGDAASVKFCHQVGMDYVSPSPFGVPIARLAAAQAVIEERAAGRSKAKGKRKK